MFKVKVGSALVIIAPPLRGALRFFRDHGGEPARFSGLTRAIRGPFALTCGTMVSSMKRNKPCNSISTQATAHWHTRHCARSHNQGTFLDDLTMGTFLMS